MQIATFEDIMFILRSLTKSKISISLAKKISSILVGAGYLLPVGEYGHYRTESSKFELTTIRDGFKNLELELRIEIAQVINDSDVDFRKIVEAPIHVN